MESGSKRTKSENVDSLYSVVTDDLSWSNVDIDMSYVVTIMLEVTNLLPATAKHQKLKTSKKQKWTFSEKGEGCWVLCLPALSLKYVLF